MSDWIEKLRKWIRQIIEAISKLFHPRPKAPPPPGTDDDPMDMPIDPPKPPR